MSDYHSIKYTGVFVPTTTVDIGTAVNTFGNIFLANSLTVGDTTVDETSLNVPKISNIVYVGDNTAADIAGGETVTINGSGFKSGASVIIDGVAVNIVTVSSSTAITFLTPAKAAGSYSLYVVNTDGGTAISLVGIQYSGVPSWTTAAGSLGSLYETQSFDTTVTATGNDIPISYSIGSGTLPGGITLTSGNGKISGTANLVNGSTTFNFAIVASDYQNQDVSRNFNITVNPDSVTWNSPANNTTISQYEHSSVNQALSASSLLGYSISYAANSLPTGVTISGSNITGTLPGTATTANSSSLITATSATTNKSANRTVNFSIQPDVVTWSSPANGSTYNVNTNDSASIALSASSAAGRSISYSATGLPSGLSISGSNITGTYTGSGSSTATITATAATTGKTADRTLNFNVTAPFNITYLTQKNQFINPQSNGYLVSHPAGVQAGDLCVLFHATHSQPPAGEYFLQDAPSGFTFVSYRFDAGIGGGIRAANLASYRVLPNTNDIALPGVKPFGGSDIAGTGATVFCAFYFRPNRSISSVTVGSLNQGLNIFGSGSSYPSGSGEAYPDLKSGTSTVSPSGQTAPVVVLGGSFVPGSGYTHTFSSSPAFDGTVGPVTGDGMANFIGGYKLYQNGTSPANHTLTYGPNDGYDKILLSFFLRVS